MSNETHDEEFDPISVVLEDEDGKTYDFMIIDSLEYNNEIYHALTTVEESEDGDDLVILRSEEIDGEPMLGIIDDDDEYEKIADMFIERLADDYDID